MPIDLIQIAAQAVEPGAVATLKNMETLVNVLIAALSALAASKGWSVWTAAKDQKVFNALAIEREKLNLEIAKSGIRGLSASNIVQLPKS